MTIRSRIALFFNVKTSAALDEIEDPREVLDYAYGQQQVQLRTLKRGLLDVAAARRQLERQQERLRARIPRLEEQARQGVRSRREDLARLALQRKQATLQELEHLEQQLVELRQEEQRLGLADQHLSQRVERFRLHRTLLSARYSAAEAQARVGETLAGLVSDEEMELSLAVERSEEKVERLSARAIAVDVLTTVAADPLERELFEVSSAEAVEAELALLRTAEHAARDAAARGHDAQNAASEPKAADADTDSNEGAKFGEEQKSSEDERTNEDTEDTDDTEDTGEEKR